MWQNHQLWSPVRWNFQSRLAALSVSTSLLLPIRRPEASTLRGEARRRSWTFTRCGEGSHSRRTPGNRRQRKSWPWPGERWKGAEWTGPAHRREKHFQRRSYRQTPIQTQNGRPCAQLIAAGTWERELRPSPASLPGADVRGARLPRLFSATQVPRSLPPGTTGTETLSEVPRGWVRAGRGPGDTAVVSAFAFRGRLSGLGLCGRVPLGTQRPSGYIRSLGSPGLAMTQALVGVGVPTK